MRTRRYALASVAGLLVATVAAAHSNGPRPDHVRIPWPAEAPATCVNCHSDGAVNGYAGSLALSGQPAAYVADTTYRLRLELSDRAVPADRLRWGFQLAVVDAALAQAGLLQSLPPAPLDSTFVIYEPTRDLDYIRQSFNGSFQTAWEFDWVAPAGGTGDARFYFCANAGNGDGNSTGDHVFCANLGLPEEVCDPLPGPIRQLLAVRSGRDIEWSWQADLAAAEGYRLYGVVSKVDLPAANGATPTARRVCPAPTVADTACLDRDAVDATEPIYVQVVGVCSSGLEGPN